MGACNFRTSSKGNTAKEAFSSAVEDARYEYGHGGYTGTIAEKNDFVMVNPPEGIDTNDFVEEWIEETADKWGPAGCIDLGDGKYLFFGMARC